MAEPSLMSKAMPVSISLPLKLWLEVDSWCEKAGITRSQFIKGLVEEYADTMDSPPKRVAASK